MICMVNERPDRKAGAMVSVNIAALVLRLTVDGTMMAHGWNHAFGDHAASGAAESTAPDSSSSSSS
jgi:hypothetical protein